MPMKPVYKAMNKKSASKVAARDSAVEDLRTASSTGGSFNRGRNAAPLKMPPVKPKKAAPKRKK